MLDLTTTIYTYLVDEDFHNTTLIVCLFLSVTTAIFATWRRFGQGLIVSMSSLYSQDGNSQQQQQQQQQRHLERQPTQTRHDISIHKTQLLQSAISHRRLFPERHAFKYSFLTVGIPVRSSTSNWLLSVDDNQKSQKSWWRRGVFRVTAEDHLYRGSNGRTLAENLDVYLKQEGLDPASFPYVYLVTSPRFLNYKFTPASFWYLYDTDLHVAYVIAEVNNTFDERRMYLFHQQHSQPPDQAQEVLNKTFKSTCDKDFHVSPFSSRKGTYSISTVSPVDTAKLDITVVLRSSKGHPKLMTRLWSVARALDPLESSTLSSLWFVFRWGWTVLMTFFRIAFEAVLLAQYRKLSIWYRPEPAASAVSRQAKASEVLLASIFKQYLWHVLDTSSADLEILLDLGITQNRAASSVQRVKSKASAEDSTSPKIQLSILTPQFYRQMITYRNFVDFLTRMLRDPHTENHTAWCSDPDALISKLEDTLSPDSETQQSTHAFPVRLLLDFFWTTFILFRPTQKLKGVYPAGFPRSRLPYSKQLCYQSPSDSPVPIQEQATADSIEKNSAFQIDTFVRTQCAVSLQLQYMLAVLNLHLRTNIMTLLGGE